MEKRISMIALCALTALISTQGSASPSPAANNLPRMQASAANGTPKSQEQAWAAIEQKAIALCKNPEMAATTILNKLDPSHTGRISLKQWSDDFNLIDTKQLQKITWNEIEKFDPSSDLQVIWRKGSGPMGGNFSKKVWMDAYHLIDTDYRGYITKVDLQDFVTHVCHAANVTVS